MTLPNSTSRTVPTIVEFCRFVRERGLSVGVTETLASLVAAQTVGLADREDFKVALRAVLCSSKQDWDLFDRLFEDFWGRKQDPSSTLTSDSQAKRSPARSTLRSGIAELMGTAKDGDDQDHGKAVTGATALDRLRKVDFSQVSQDDLPELERIATLLLRRMAQRLSRRLKTMQRRGPIDLRRTIHRSISRGGDPVYLSRKGKRLARTRLVILLDVSGSMNAYSLFLVRFAYALQRHFSKVDTFLFSTRLQEITAALRVRNLSDALAALSQESSAWAGGTKIGESMREFNERFARRLLGRDTLVMILSDGWDTAEPEILARELSAIQRHSRLLLWLNPLLGMKDYEPLTRAMSAALPYIDVFAAAHNLESLLALERVVKTSGRRQLRSRWSQR